MKHLVVLVTLAAALLMGAGNLAFSAEDAKPGAPGIAGKPVNSVCPVGGRAAKADKVTVYKGETIALCCAKCLAKFEAEPEKYAKNIERDKKKQYVEGSCCDKADKKGETCKHPCCVAAEKEGKVCTKCNKPKEEKK